jgi:NO-binding membrane sensor protein with MHYT domain
LVATVLLTLTVVALLRRSPPGKWDLWTAAVSLVLCSASLAVEVWGLALESDSFNELNWSALLISPSVAAALVDYLKIKPSRSSARISSRTGVLRRR